MRIYVIHQYFKTPSDGGGIRSYYLTKYLVNQGYNVSVITAYNGKVYKNLQLDGIDVHYLPVYYTNHLSFYSRIHAFYRFVRMSIQHIKKLPKPDLNYVISTPLSTGVIALFLKRIRKVPFIFEVGDLWPKAPIQLKVINNPVIKALSRWLEKRIYRNAKAIVALSPDIKNDIAKTVPDKVISVVTNMSDIDFFKSTQKEPSLVEKYNLNNKFVISYTGTVGLANHLEYLLAVAEVSQKDRHIRFVIMGSGARWDDIKQLAGEKKLNNIIFLPPGNKNQVSEILNVSDAIYISFKNAPVLASGSPNKFFDGLAAGKLIILNFQGWIASIIAKHECGFSYEPLKPEEFFNKLAPYIENGQLLKNSQYKARQLAESEFSLDNQLKKLDQFLTDVLGSD